MDGAGRRGCKECDSMYKMVVFASMDGQRIAHQLMIQHEGGGAGCSAVTRNTE
ncbi:hypothetical protein BC628DRAFT_1362323 [Trametes gibbosa]|nr:hypothetical protein BC628DRAFT_1362323 [Trametes gibbosa]